MAGPAGRGRIVEIPRKGKRPSLEQIWAQLDRDRLVQTAVGLVDIPSATGEEAAIAHHVRDVFREMGLRTRMQEIEPERYNVLGTLEGDGSGPVLMFNGHMDTSYTGKEDYLPDTPSYQPKGYVEDGWIYGLGIFNMKGALAAYIEAVRAIQRSGLPLTGDVMIAAVSGEIEKAQVDRYQGRAYRGAGSGTTYLVRHGGVADMAVIGEPTIMRIVPAHMGDVWMKITVRGTPAHTRFADRAVNSISKMRKILDLLEEWAPRYRAEHPFMTRNANVNIAAIEGGWPFRCARTPVYCSLYVDVRILPDQHPLEVKREIESLIAPLEAADPDLRVETEMLLSQPPASVPQDSPIFLATAAAHRSVFNTEPEVVAEGFYSDASVLNRFNVPTLNYGPSGRTRAGREGWNPSIGEHLLIEDLVNCTKVYVALIADVCTKTRVELGIGR